MPLLDALGGEGSESTEVLGKPDRPHDLGQLLSRFHIEHPQVECDGGVRLERSAHDSDLYGDFDLADERPVLGTAPPGERGVMAAARSVGVGARLYRAPVVTGG